MRLGFDRIGYLSRLRVAKVPYFEPMWVVCAHLTWV